MEQDKLRVTMNGIGERAGNTALEEVVMAVKCRRDIPVFTEIDTKMIMKTIKTSINLNENASAT